MAFSRPQLPFKPGYIEVSDGKGGRMYRSLTPTFSGSGYYPPEEETMTEMEEMAAIVNILLGDEPYEGNGANKESEGTEESV